MKKYYLVTGIALISGILSVNYAFGQSDQTAPVTVTIDLTSPVLSIDLGADPNVDFVYATPEDYTTPQVEPKISHFTVVSNQAYDITVAAQEEFTVIPENDSPIPLSVVQVSVDPSTIGGGTPSVVPLSQTAGTLVSDGPATLGTTYNINYTIPDATSLLNKQPEQYSTTVIYTATQL